MRGNRPTELFIKGDITALARYWSTTYIQHNPTFPTSIDGFLEGQTSGPKVTYEIGLVVSEGDLMMVHGRYTGIGPKPTVGVYIFRIAQGKIAMQWEGLQEEVTANVSGNSMFDPNEGM